MNISLLVWKQYLFKLNDRLGRYLKSKLLFNNHGNIIIIAIIALGMYRIQ